MRTPPSRSTADERKEDLLMDIRRIEIDYETGALTVDADVNEEYGREFQFELAQLPEIRDLAQEIARQSQLAVVARMRAWMLRLEEGLKAPAAL
jgi:hypothetical protein